MSIRCKRREMGRPLWWGLDQWTYKALGKASAGGNLPSLLGLTEWRERRPPPFLLRKTK